MYFSKISDIEYLIIVVIGITDLQIVKAGWPLPLATAIGHCTAIALIRAVTSHKATGDNTRAAASCQLCHTSCAVFHCNPSASAHTVPLTRVVCPVFVSAMQVTPEA